ncbi:hypothetical protein FBZ89_103461 [Nitrospirillum amazonense]|uniref:Uncharacterized protein n=1 Tax=Nitrospirillum amazonense TaxID=28077 RepID=A0A560FMN7_9PROT|nr:hypothetical protein FBZ89_103461 [Nitrospirillum amazonense]
MITGMTTAVPGTTMDTTIKAPVGMIMATKITGLTITATMIVMATTMPATITATMATAMGWVATTMPHRPTPARPSPSA